MLVFDSNGTITCRCFDHRESEHLCDDVHYSTSLSVTTRSTHAAVMMLGQQQVQSTRGCTHNCSPVRLTCAVCVCVLHCCCCSTVCRYVAFSGAGQTLGTSSSAGASSSQQAAAASSAAPAGEWEGVDESKPTTSIQLRLYDGSRMVARMNTTQTVQDIRRFIRASRPDMATSYQLMTGFPPAPIADETQSLEAAGLLNAVINQRK